MNRKKFLKFLKNIYLEFLNLIGHFIIFFGIFNIYLKISKYFFIIITYHYPSKKLINLHLNFIKNYFNIKGLDSISQKGEDHQTKDILITFDDGYQYLFKELFPLFTKAKVPFTIFTSTKNIEDKEPFWVDIYELKKKRGSKFGQDFKDMKYNDRKKTLNLTEEELNSEFLKHRLPLGWHEIKEMINSGLVEVGDHGYSHTSLILLNEEEIKTELLASKCLIKDRLEIEVTDFSYPNGDFSLSSGNILRELGYRCALTTLPNKNYVGTNPYFLRRIDADDSKLGILVLKIMGLYYLFTALKLEKYLINRGLPIKELRVKKKRLEA